MNPSQKNSFYHSEIYRDAGAAIMSFEPVKQIHQHLCAFHCYSFDQNRHVEAHHFCTHLSKDFHQCIIYDSAEPQAKLIGIEYIVSEELFNSLPVDEKKYWHSHKYEVESGMLQLEAKDLVPGLIVKKAEEPAMLELQKTYGKTIHTWPVDTSPDLPLGPPNLMMSYTSDDQAPHELVRKRDERLGVSSGDRRNDRKSYLPPYEKNVAADEWERTGKGIQFEPKEVKLQ